MSEKFRHLSKKLDIIEVFLSDFNNSYSGREIARISKMNHQTALSNLNEMVESNILSFRILGRNKEYSINLSNQYCKILIEMAEQKKALEMLKNKELKITIQDMLEYSETIVLFGSFASGEQDSRSDMDILIIGKSDKKKIKKITSTMHRQINVKYTTIAEIKQSLKKRNPLMMEIVKNHVLFGQTSQIIDNIIRWYSDRR